MGHVFAEVTLKNVYDMAYAQNGYIKEEEIRSLTVQALVDTGATRLCISEEMRQKLGLRIVGSTPIYIANGTSVTCQVTEPVEIICKNRSSTFNAVIIPGSVVALLGVIPLEDLDLMVNPVTQELVGVHGDERIHLALSSFEDQGAH